MNEKLQQAILAARNGQVTDAQLLLTEVLKEDPDETQAWFLLSTLVDSEQKKIAYLGKVLALEPDHQMAQKMLTRLQGPAQTGVEERDEAIESVRVEETVIVEVEEEASVGVPVVRSSDVSDFLAQEKGETLPDWLIEEEGLEISEELEPAQVDTVMTPAAEIDADLPDWLQEEVTEDWSEPAPPEEVPAVVEHLPDKKTPTESVPKPKATVNVKDDQKKQRRFLTGLLYALVMVTAVVFIIMIYLAWTVFF